MGNVHDRTQRKKCTMLQLQSLKISKDRWIFCLTSFDCSRLGYSDNDQVSGPVEFENFMDSIHVFMSAVGIDIVELLDDARQC